jgi:undecaprenyl-diphosphatase
MPQWCPVSAFEAIVLGIVQGLTEFLPISSSGHLRIVPALVGWDDPGSAFTAVIQLGTMAAVVLYFRADLWRIGVAWLRSLRDRSQRNTLDARMGWYLIIGTIPIGIFGILFKDQIESGARDLRLIGTTLIVLGIVLLIAERVGAHRKTVDELHERDGLAFGLAQSMALVPGVSRSGATIMGGYCLGLSRGAATEFSFFLAIPVMAAATMYDLLKSADLLAPADLPVFAVGFGMSFVSALVVVKLFVAFVSRSTFVPFAVYRIVFGVGLLLWYGEHPW